jgi:CRP/FNR family transcriptional regulator, cyclic AMP receptor protein
MTIDTFLKQFKPILYRRKERIIIPGIETDNIYYIIQGYVIQSIVSPNGNQFTPYIFTPKTFFPLIWNKDDGLSNIHDYEYESLTPVEVYRISKDKLALFLKDNPETSFGLNEQLVRYSTELLNQLETRIFSDAFHMVILGILDLAKLFGKKQSKQTLISYWFTHQDIANISGLSREVVTIQMNRLIKRKLISYQSHFIVINDLGALEIELQSEK